MRILVIEDHPLYRQAITQTLVKLDAEVEIVEAETMAEIEACVADGQPLELALVDLMMPSFDGFDALRILKSKREDTPVVVVSAIEDKADVSRALKLGAAGYIPKSSSGDVIENALRLVLSGGVYLPPIFLDDDREVAPRPDRAVSSYVDNAVFDRLTPRQKAVLSQLAKGRSNKHIARELGISDATVKIHVNNILRALNVSNRTEAAALLLQAEMDSRGQKSD